MADRPRLLKPKEPPKSADIADIVRGVPGTEPVDLIDIMRFVEQAMIEEARLAGKVGSGHPDPRIRAIGVGAERALNIGTSYLQTAMLWAKEARSFDLP